MIRWEEQPDGNWLGYSGQALVATATKADADRPWGLPGVRALADALAGRVPLVAIGGIDAHNAGDVIEAGADGVAVISSICGAEDPGAASREIRAFVDRALATRKARP